MTSTTAFAEQNAESSASAARIARASRRPASLGSTPAGAIALSMGEPDAGTPGPIVEAAVAALRSGRTRYTNLSGAPGLRQSLAEKLTESCGRQVSAEQVVVTHGGSAGLAATVLALINPGDKVLVPEPTYSLYADHLAMVGAEAVWVANRADGTLDLDRLALEAPSSRMIIMCNPGNPTGRVYSATELRDLAAIVEANPHLLLLSDEAYADIVFDGMEFLSALELRGITGQVICCSTFSKTYAMTGWRLGYVVASPTLSEKINLLHRTLNGSVNTFVQDAALVALETPAEDLRAMAHSYQKRRDIVMAKLSGIPGVSLLVPQGAFYAFVKIDSALTSDEMTARFAAAGVIVRSGSEFGPSGEGHVRLSFATDPETLKAGLDRFIAAAQSFV